MVLKDLIQELINQYEFEQRYLNIILNNENINYSFELYHNLILLIMLFFHINLNLLIIF